MGRRNGRGARLPTTRWTWVQQSGLRSPEARQLLGRLLELYRPALRAHLTLTKQIPADRADDLLQGFIAERVVEKELFAAADPERGRFRSFLLTALDRYVANQFRHENRQRRSPASGQPMPFDERLDHTPTPPPDPFEAAWAKVVLEETIRRMRQQCHREDRQALWGVFEGRVLRPALDAQPPLPYPTLVEQFALTSPTRASNLLVTAKRMFERHLREVIGEYADGQELEDEVAALREAINRGGAEIEPEW